ncbi:hypothetical protein SORBI_3008G065866 [Sorghum bicolor]|uniref:Uncharacterized protein n=1 Tax=Sorghum bicolor TaxID=4558 RepID=A0A1Z5R5Y7_SORBI|nr:hypothetical protein SORBI_3008G065866 [Sorghum bicolor]
MFQNTMKRAEPPQSRNKRVVSTFARSGVSRPKCLHKGQIILTISNTSKRCIWIQMATFQYGYILCAADLQIDDFQVLEGIRCSVAYMIYQHDVQCKLRDGCSAGNHIFLRWQHSGYTFCAAGLAHKLMIPLNLVFPICKACLLSCVGAVFGIVHRPCTHESWNFDRRDLQKFCSCISSLCPIFTLVFFFEHSTGGFSHLNGYKREGC